MTQTDNEILRQRIYGVICYMCEIEQSEFSPDLLINYGEYEQFGECADDLTFEHIPEALGLSSYDLPFENNIYFQDSGNLVTLIIDLFNRKKDTRPPLTIKQYVDMLLILYKEYQEEQAKEQQRIDDLIQQIPKDQKDRLESKLYLLLMRALSLTEKDFSPDLIINDGIYKLSGRKAEKLLNHSALCLKLSRNEVYNHFQKKKYFDLTNPIIKWTIITLFSPVFIFAFTVMTLFFCIELIINCCRFIVKRKWNSLFKEQPISPNEPKLITAKEYAYEMLGLWAKKNAKDIDPFLFSIKQ